MQPRCPSSGYWGSWGPPWNPGLATMKFLHVVWSILPQFNQEVSIQCLPWHLLYWSHLKSRLKSSWSSCCEFACCEQQIFMHLAHFFKLSTAYFSFLPCLSFWYKLISACHATTAWLQITKICSNIGTNTVPQLSSFHKICLSPFLSCSAFYSTSLTFLHFLSIRS